VDLKREHDFFVGIDSDGCVFDTMELKHKECFIPSFIRHFGLQGVSKYAREAAEFVNLYSKSRGINRFPALAEQLDWLRRRPEVERRGIAVPVLNGLMRWIGTESRLGNPALERANQATPDPDLTRTLAWSQDVNAAIREMVHGVPPFPCVRLCLEQLLGKADMMVVSATPTEALHKEWQEHDLAQYVQIICGQEHGTKKEMLTAAAAFPANQALMIGDAPGDCKAAMANRCLFFPINPGNEETSWQRLHDEGIPRLFDGTFAGAYQDDLLGQFDACLPEQPPWPVGPE
jgi:phosphoglycolate phosphatase-like HAD superfamily hydrolase